MDICHCLDAMRCRVMLFAVSWSLCRPIWWLVVRARSPTPFSLPLLALFSIERVQLRAYGDRACTEEEERGEFKHNGFRHDMYAFGKTVVTELGGHLSYSTDTVFGTQTDNEGICSKEGTEVVFLGA